MDIATLSLAFYCVIQLGKHPRTTRFALLYYLSKLSSPSKSPSAAPLYAAVPLALRKDTKDNPRPRSFGHAPRLLYARRTHSQDLTNESGKRQGQLRQSNQDGLFCTRATHA